MLKYLIKVIGLHFPFAIVFALVLVLFQSRIKENPGLKKMRPFALTVGIILSLVLFAMKTWTVLVNREFVGIAVTSWLILMEVLLGISFVLPAKMVVKKWTEKVAFFGLIVGLLVNSIPDILLYLPLMLPVGESFLQWVLLFKFLGYFLGVGLLVLLFYLTYWVFKQLPANTLSVFAMVILSMLLFLQIPALLQPLVARRIILASPLVFNYIIFMINHNQWFNFIYLGILITAVVLVLYHNYVRVPVVGNPAEMRKEKAGKRRKIRYGIALIGVIALLFLTTTVVESYTNKEVELSPAEELIVKGEEFLIPLDQVSDGHLHRFAYTTPEGVEIRFIVIQKNATSFGVGFDACEICGVTGYYERQDGVVCKLCDVVMNTSTIGFKGGCNPVPLEYSVADGHMVIKKANVMVEEARFGK